MGKFKVGDVVTGNYRNTYMATNKDSICVVVNVNYENEKMDVVLLYNNHGLLYKGGKYFVEIGKFKFYKEPLTKEQKKDVEMLKYVSGFNIDITWNGQLKYNCPIFIFLRELNCRSILGFNKNDDAKKYIYSLAKECNFNIYEGAKE